jgi:hypothetical protein
MGPASRVYGLLNSPLTIPAFALDTGTRQQKAYWICLVWAFPVLMGRRGKRRTDKVENGIAKGFEGICIRVYTGHGLRDMMDDELWDLWRLGERHGKGMERSGQGYTGEIPETPCLTSREGRLKLSRGSFVNICRVELKGKATRLWEVLGKTARGMLSSRHGDYFHSLPPNLLVRSDLLYRLLLFRFLGL